MVAARVLPLQKPEEATIVSLDASSSDDLVPGEDAQGWTLDDPEAVVEKLAAKCLAHHPEADIDAIRDAFFLGEEKHRPQQRRSGDPYFIHPVRVAATIADMRLDGPSIVAALLHDVIEDTDVAEAEIAERFGAEVAFLVDGVTKLGRINFRCKEDQQAESFRKMIVAMARDIRVLIIKLADRLDNMRTLEHMSRDAQERIASETVEIYAPLSSRLGIHWLKALLEDLSFKHLHPDAHQYLSEEIARTASDATQYIGEVAGVIRALLTERGIEAKVQGRAKHLYSIHNKMVRTGCDLDQVNDYIAFRVLLDDVSDCYATLGVMHSQWTPIPGRFKDYIALPKANLYQSLHTTVIGPGRRRMEIQIRTHGMHQIAEFGIAAHWRYKEGGHLPKQHADADRFGWLRRLMEFQRELSDPAEFLDSVKVDLFPDEVYVFTPAGEVKTFPRGATPIDFAYAVHSEVGEHCAGARVNNVIVPLRYKLHNGDVVEILTSHAQRPSKDWLDFVGTGRARSQIRAFLRQEERFGAIRLGKELLIKQLRKAGLSHTKFIKSQDLSHTLENFHTKTVEDLYAQIGYGRIKFDHLLSYLQPGQDGKKPEPIRQSLFERATNRMRRGVADDGIIIDGIDNLLVRFGKCCNPVSGDSVTGWITRGRGITIHRRDCQRALEVDPERRVDVSWAKDAALHLPVSVRVVTDDRPGVLAAVTSVLTQHKINIKEAVCRSEAPAQAVNTFHFSVENVSQLRKVMRLIAQVHGVVQVTRL